MEALFYWCGAIVGLIGLVGVGAFLLLWTIDRVLALTKTVSVVTEWYVREKLGRGPRG